MLEFLAGFADRRRVDDRHHLFDVVHDHTIKQVLVTVLQRDQVEVAFEVGRFCANVAEDPKLLLGHGMHPRRQQSP